MSDEIDFRGLTEYDKLMHLYGALSQLDSCRYTLPKLDPSSKEAVNRILDAVPILKDKIWNQIDWTIYHGEKPHSEGTIEKKKVFEILRYFINNY